MKLRDAIEDLRYLDDEPSVRVVLEFFDDLQEFGPAAYNYYDRENECYIIAPAEDPLELLEPLDLFYEIDFDRDY